jgi:uncharacterized protein (DUF983 family)
VLLLGRALLRHCPVCGSGGLFRRWFTIVERCPRCGLRFERTEGHWIGYLGLNTIVSFSLLFVVLVVGFVLSAPEFDVVPLLVAGGLTAVVFPVLFLPWSRTLWIAVDLLMRPLEPGEAPGLEAPVARS